MLWKLSNKWNWVLEWISTKIMQISLLEEIFKILSKLVKYWWSWFGVGEWGSRWHWRQFLCFFENSFDNGYFCRILWICDPFKFYVFHWIHWVGSWNLKLSNHQPEMTQMLFYPQNIERWGIVQVIFPFPQDMMMSWSR